MIPPLQKFIEWFDDLPVPHVACVVGTSKREEAQPNQTSNATTRIFKPQAPVLAACPG